MKRNLLLLIILFTLPFLIGSSTPIRPDESSFTLVVNSVFQPGSNVGPISIYPNYKEMGEFRFKLFKITDVKSFYKGMLASEYSFDILGKEFLLKYTKQVKEWSQSVNNNLHLDIINEPGTYILQAIKDNLVAYCPVVVSRYSIIHKSAGRQILAFVQDVQSGSIAGKTDFTVFNDGKEFKGNTNSDGLSMIEIDKKFSSWDNSRLLVFADLGDEVLVNNPYFYSHEGNRFVAYTYTNQPVYRPGQQVFFKSILREKSGNEYNLASGSNYQVTVKSPKNKEVYNKELASNETGTIAGDFILDEESDLGTYSILIQSGEQQYYGSFIVEEYKKPEYEVKVNIPKNHFANGDKIEGTVKADYYFGSPVTKGSVSVNIYKQYFWRPWWYYSEYSWFYKSFQKQDFRGFGNMQYINSVQGQLNEKGEYEFSYQVNEDEQWDYVYVISAEVTDESRRAVSGRSSVFVTRGSFSLSASTDKYFAELGKPVVFRVNAVDFNDKPVRTDFKIVFTYQNEIERYKGNQITFKDSITGRTDEAGQAQIRYMPFIQQSGYYYYVVSAKDEKGRIITAQGNFYYGDNRYYHFDYGQGIQILTDKDTYKKGDSLTAFISLPDSSTDVVITYESSSIFFYKKYSVSDNRLVIKEKLDDRFSPSFNIGVVYMKNGRFNNQSKMIGVLDEEKFLNISIQPDKKQYRPADLAKYLISVQDKKGNPVAGADLSIGLVDEAIYSIQEESVQDISSFFYSPQYNYVNVNSSYNKYSYSYSRKLSALDKYGFDEKKMNRKGDGGLFGTIMSDENTPAGRLQVFLLNEESFYSVHSDTAGKYIFKDILKGKYDLLVFGESGIMYSSTEPVSVGKNSKHDINLNNIDGNIPGGRTGGVFSTIESRDALPSSPVNQNLALSKKMEAPDYKQAVVRSNFTDAAFWTANILTDKNGNASVSFKMPDNLTTWRTTVRGITKETLVGQETNKTITRKDLLVRMETPRFFREGDVLTVSTIVHNYLDQKKRTKITFNSGNLKLVGSQINTPGYSTNLFDSKNNMYELTIDKNTELRIDWRLSVDAPYTNAKLSVEALTDQESDAMELTIPVLPKGIKVTIPLSADLNEQNEHTIKFNIPNNIDLSSAKVAFNVTPSLSGTMLKALDELAGYPYGCVEQTMSRFLPTLIVSNAIKEINAPLKSNTVKELPKMIEAGVKRLYNLQHDDGGWGWWENDKSSGYMTAYVVYGLALSQKAGYKISEEVFSKGVQRVIASIKEGKANDNRTSPAAENYDSDNTSMAYLVYSLSEADAANNKQLIISKINELSSKKLNPYAYSLLLLSALNITEKETADKLAITLKSLAVTNGGFTTWKGKEWHYSWQDDEVQTTAFAVKALLKAGYKDVDNSVRWLLMQRKGFAWRSTQETASIIFALTDYLKITNELNPAYTVKVYVNDKLQLDKSFTSEDIFTEPKTVELTEGLKSGDNIIRIIKEGKGKVYFSGLNEYFTKELFETNSSSGNQQSNYDDKNQNNNPGSGTNGQGMFKVVREYFILSPIQKEGRIVYQKTYLNRPIISGEDVFVKTKVTSSTGSLQYFMLEDMLPSGFEVVKDENKYEIEGESSYNNRRPWDHMPWRWFYADKEYRDEKVSFFVTYPSQEMEFSYLIKAQIPGKYYSMPSQASLMYYPEYNGNSSIEEFEVKDK